MRLVVTEGYSIAIDDTIVEGFAYLSLLCHSCSTKNPRTKMGVVAGNIAPKVSLTVWQFIGGDKYPLLTLLSGPISRLKNHHR